MYTHRNSNQKYDSLPVDLCVYGVIGIKLRSQQQRSIKMSLLPDQDGRYSAASASSKKTGSYIVSAVTKCSWRAAVFQWKTCCCDDVIQEISFKTSISEDASEPSLPLSSENFSLTVVCECFQEERNGQSVLSGAARPSFLSPGVDKSLRQLPASEPHPLWEHLRREVRLRARAQRCLHGKQLRGVVL